MLREEMGAELSNRPKATVASESVFETRARIFAYVEKGVIDSAVVAQLAPNGKGVADEAVLWDFKIKLPHRPRGVKLSEAALRTFDYEMHEVVKDAVAFYNSYGGYILAGFSDRDRILSGYGENFEVDDLNRKLTGAVGRDIECVYRLAEHPDPSGTNRPVGLLFVPRRPASILPAMFLRDAPPGRNGRIAYSRDRFYLRQRDECRPASSPDDFEFLYNDDRRRIFPVRQSMMLENNLPERNTELGKLIGRNDQLSQLWAWLADDFDSVKLISGLGGVGKTSIAYSFAESFIYSSPASYDKLVWLGAKKENFQASINKLVVPPRIDFFDINGFLRELLLELGCPETSLRGAEGERELLSLALQHLQEYRYLVIVDDVDTLEDEDQQRLLHLLTLLFARSRSKALMTARRNLQLPRGGFIEVEGIGLENFDALVASKCELFRLHQPSLLDPANLELLHDLTGGSPQFVISVLRLISLGDTFEAAVRQWRGASGDDVRRAAFSREVGRLRLAEAKILLASVYLKETSPVELASIVELSQFETQKAIDVLRGFSMITVASDLPGGATMITPHTIGLLTNVIEARVADHELIKQRCAYRRSLAMDPTSFVSDAIRRAMAFLRNGQAGVAVNILGKSLETLPNHPDLLSMLGRARYECGKGSYAASDEAFAQAYSFGCKRRELFEFWLRLRQEVEDWQGVIDLSECAEGDLRLNGRYAPQRHHAYCQIAQAFERANRYEEAERVYLSGAESLRETLSKAVGPRGENTRDLQLRLVSNWLRTIAILCRHPSDYRRLLGAIVKSVRDFKYLDRHALERALVMFQVRLDGLDRRASLSTHITEAIGQDLSRLREICEFADERELLLSPPDLVNVAIAKAAALLAGSGPSASVTARRR